MREYAKKPENQSRTLDSNPKASRQAPIDVILQRYKQNIQRYASAEEEEPLQGKFDTVQREEIDEDELLQGKFEFAPFNEQESMQREEKPNNTGLPDNIKAGIENLSGYSMDDVRVHYNSEKPAQLNALAYAQGTDIHVAPGQKKHLPHETWHVVQQKQGRVQPTMQMKEGVSVNGDKGLEHEADIMSEKAMTIGNSALNEIITQHATDKNSTLPLVSNSHIQLESIDLSTGSPSTHIAQLALITVNPQSGPVRLDAERHSGPDLYMWNTDQQSGQDPMDTIGPTDLFTAWGGAQLATAATFHRAHAYGKQFGGAGDENNVAWWAGTSEALWTPCEDKIRGDNNGGHAANWQPGENEVGDYTVTRNLHPVMAINAKFRNPLISACRWGLRADSTAFLALLPTLANDVQRQEADNARQTALGKVEEAIDALLNNININNAARLVINSMTINYTRTSIGMNPGHSRTDINTTVPNTLTIDDFGLVDNDQLVWNALSTFQGMFGRGRQQLTSRLNMRLAAPKISEIEKSRLRTEATQELINPTEKEIGVRFGEKLRGWQTLNPQIVLGPINDGWGRV